MSGEFFGDRVFQPEVEGSRVTSTTQSVKVLFRNRLLKELETLQLGLARAFSLVLFDCRFDDVLHQTLRKIFRKLLVTSEVLHVEVDD